jgi:DNA-binding GntR family transcriptional regulator
VRDKSRAIIPTFLILIANPKKALLADRVYQAVKKDIADFRLTPGDKFTETELAEKLRVSRTPVREALFRLQSEGFVEVQFRSGWLVKPFDFEMFEHLYDLRMVLETTAVHRLSTGALGVSAKLLDALRSIWLVPVAHRLRDGRAVARLDEQFHAVLLSACGNPEMIRVHADVTDRIRIIRRLDFTLEERISATYEEHGKILLAILQKQEKAATELLRRHIDTSKAEVRRLTLHRLQLARRNRVSKLDHSPDEPSTPGKTLSDSKQDPSR